MNTAARPESSSRQVVILDDDRCTRLMLGKLLNLEGIETLATASEGEAFKLLQRPRVGLLIQDFTRQAGTLGGFRFLQRLRTNRRTRNIPVVILSGTPRGTIERAFREAGSDWSVELIGLISKPASMNELRKLTRRVQVFLTIQ